MTHRDWHASGGVGLATRPAPDPPRAGAAPVAERIPFNWADLYHSLPPARQHELLDLAQRQGILYSHQLPESNGIAGDERRQWLAQLLAGKLRDLPSFTPASLTAIDEALDATQRDAVARAVATPDICVIQGLPGSGKSKVAAEIVVQAAARGQRVLLLAAHDAALDRVLEQVGQRETLCPVRCMPRNQPIAAIPASVRPFTLEERVRAIRDQSLPAARAAAHEAEQRRDACRAQQPTWQRLEELAVCRTALAEKLESIDQRRTHLAQDVQHVWDTAVNQSEYPPGTFTYEAAAWHLRHSEDRHRLDREEQAAAEKLAALSREKNETQHECDRLAPLAQARRARRWWTLAWWKALFRPHTVIRHDELAARLQDIQAKVSDLTDQLANLRQERQAVEDRSATQRLERVEAETALQEMSVSAEDERLRCELGAVDRQWQEVSDELRRRGSEPPAPGGSDVRRARQEWETRLHDGEEHAKTAGRWATCLEEAAAALPSRLPSLANLVAATPAALADDSHFAGSEIAFDVLLVDEADQVSEPDFLAAARRARRWVLIGEAIPGDNASANRRPGVRQFRTTAVRPPFFHRLWQQFHFAPRQLPFCWTTIGGKLCCQLRSVNDEDRRWVECEPLADRPDIDLCILAAPHAEPVLVEVRFPQTTSIAEAKALIFRELQEVPAQAHGQAFVWTENPEVVRVQLGTGDCESANVVVVPLADGVLERVQANASGPAAAFDTLGFDFDCRLGWTRHGAMEWLSRHLGVRDAGRTAYLSQPHRMQPALGHLVLDLLGLSNGFLTNGCGKTPAVRFIPVPGPAGDRRRNREPRAASETPRQGPRGAGFELNLGASAHGHALSADIRAALPSRGLVNYPEALAVVQTLEELLSDPAFCMEAAAWQACHGSGANAVVITALHSAQVELLRALLSRSRNLLRAGLQHRGEGRFQFAGPTPLEIHVEAPPALRHRECLTLLLSVTRSHSHRAVALAEEPAWLPLTLTRASARLLLFGDPGTLLRRTQWRGAVDHLDELAAERERDLACRLVQHVLGLELPPSPTPPTAASRR